MAFTSVYPTRNVLIEEGTFGMNFTAGGTIYAGQAVIASGSSENVYAPTTDMEYINVFASKGVGWFIGVAANDATAGDPITVYPPGNKVNVNVSGSCQVGDPLTIVKYGYFASGNLGSTSGQVYAVALEDKASTGPCKVLLI